MREILSQEGYVMVGLIFFGPSLIVLMIAGILRMPDLLRRFQKSKRRRRHTVDGRLPNSATVRVK
jgi:hypothetical protein